VTDYSLSLLSAVRLLDAKIGLFALYGLVLALTALLIFFLRAIKRLQREINEVAWLCRQVLDAINLPFPESPDVRGQESLISEIPPSTAPPSASPRETEGMSFKPEDSFPYDEASEGKPLKRLFVWIASKGSHPTGPFATGVLIKNSEGEVVGRFGSRALFPNRKRAIMEALTESLRRASASGAREIVIFLSGPGAKFAVNVLKREEPNEESEGKLLELRKEFDKFELVLVDRGSNKHAEAIALESLGELGDHPGSRTQAMG